MRYKLTLAYNGSSYSGWQIQPNAMTIQELLEEKLGIILKDEFKVTGSGRTDAGVHAFKQVAHFDHDTTFDLEKVRRSLDALAGDDIQIFGIEPVSDSFHARKSVSSKTYEYFLSDEGLGVPFLKDRVYFYYKKLNTQKMQEAAKHLIGEHDFSSFKASDCNSRTQVRKILNITVERSEIFYYPIIRCAFTGNGFLKHMIRNIVGTLVEVGAEKLSVDDFAKLVELKDRCKAGPTAPAHGLYLREIVYV